MARLQVVRAEAEDRGDDLGRLAQRRNVGMLRAFGVLARLEQGLGDEAGERGVFRTLEHGHRLLALEGGDDLGLRERLQQLDRDDADLLALAAQIGGDRLGVVGDRAEAEQDGLGVVAHIGQDRGVGAAGQLRVFGHRLAGDMGNLADEMGAMVDRAGLEVGLVLHAAGQAGIVHVDERRHELAGALLERVEPLAPPLAAQLFGHIVERLVDHPAGVVALDRFLVGVEEGAQLGDRAVGEIMGAPGQVLAQLERAALGAEQHVLGDGRALDAAGGIAEVLAQQLGLRHVRFGHHVAGGEAVHRVGDGDQRQRAEPIGDRREVGGFLRVAAEQDGVAGGQQGVDVVVARHHVERVLGDDARRHLQNKTADFLADGHVVRFHPVEDALARRGVRYELAAGQRRAERAALGRMLALGLEKERVLAPDVEAAIGAERLVDFRDFGRGRDRIADDPAAHAAHHFGDRRRCHG